MRSRPFTRLAPALLLALALGGCGEDSVDPGEDDGQGGGTADCQPPHRLVQGECREPGVQDDGCPAGSWLDQDGSCQPAGVPSAACAEGFVPTEWAGCEPILPAEPCPAGLMAVPGETECREPAPCGAGPWGDIPVDATTVYVDQSYDQGAGPSDGTEIRPYTTVNEAITAAAAGALIAIAPGSYLENLVLYGKPLRLWGKCPAEVELVGTGVSNTTVRISNGASGSQLASLAIRGPDIGVTASGAGSIELQGLWIHDNDYAGIVLTGSDGPISAAVSSSLVEQNHDFGIYLWGAHADLASVVVRDTQPAVADGTLGRGIHAEDAPDTGVRSSLSVQGSLIERNSDQGVMVIGSDAVIEASVVRDTLPDAASQDRGRGISIEYAADTGARANGLLRASLIDHNHVMGVFAYGSDLTLDASVVRGTLPKASSQTSGRGIGIEDSVTGVRSRATVHASLIEHNHDVAVYVSGSDLEIDAAVVRDTMPRASNQAYGRGINVQVDRDTGQRSSATVRTTVIEQHHDLGVHVSGSDAAFDGVVIRGILPRASDQNSGRGMNIQNQPDLGAPGSATLRASLIEHNHEVGLFVAGADVRLLGVRIADTVPRPLDGLFGDGIAVWDAGPDDTVELSSCHIGGSTRAGLAVFGAAAGIQACSLSCNLFHLNRESFEGRDGQLRDRGDNRCFCAEEEQPCTALSAGLAPPEPVE